MPVLASAVVHVGAGAGLVATGVGHASIGPLLAPDSVEIDLTSTAPAPAPEAPPAPVVRDDDHAPHAPPTPPTHTHPYPVPPSHDNHPHDPSIDHAAHAEEKAETSAPSATEPGPAQAAPAMTNTAPELPRFTMVIGNGPPASGQVSTASTGSGGASVEDAVVPEAAVSVPAKLTSSPAAHYPETARASEIEADVPVEIVVDAQGSVIDARVVKTAGYGFDDAAVSAVRRYRFTPAQRAGRAVRVRMRWSVQFRLR